MDQTSSETRISELSMTTNFFDVLKDVVTDNPYEKQIDKFGIAQDEQQMFFPKIISYSLYAKGLTKYAQGCITECVVGYTS